MDSNAIDPDDLKDAFFKLQSFANYDNYALDLRHKIAKYKLTSFSSNISKHAKYLEKHEEVTKALLSKISLDVFPKSIRWNTNIDYPNFMTNEIFDEEINFGRPLIFVDFPVQMHLYCTLWTLFYGKYLDMDLGENCYGNRLLLKSDLIFGKRDLFKSYKTSYNNWWNGAIKTAKDLLNDGEDASIITFDIKDFYHNIDISFDEIEQRVSLEHEGFESFPLHQAFRQIHSRYHQIINDKRNDGENYKCLPIGTISSPVLANWYLRKLDEVIKNQIKPSYYGRYVDDIVIVLSNKNLKGDEFINSDQNPIDLFIERFLSSILRKEKEEFSLNIDGLKHLKLQRSKVFLYQFNSKNAPTLIDRLIKDQKEKSSEFRFLSDEYDEYFEDFDDNTFEQNFDTDGLNKAKFRELQDNKFKLSSFLVKLIRRRMNNGSNYQDDQIDKILNFFKGPYLIRHYYFWEKLFTLLLVAERDEEFKELFLNIQKEIDKLKTDSTNQLFTINQYEVRDSLGKHLKQSIFMALGLSPEFVDLRDSSISKDEPLITANDDLEVFRKTGLLRRHFVFHPLLQFTKRAKESKINLTVCDSLNPKDFSDNSHFKINQLDVPSRVKFYEVATLNFYKNVFTSDLGDGIKYLKDSMGEYLDINLADHKNDTSYFVERAEKINGISINEISISPLKENSDKVSKSLRVALINRYVDWKDDKKSLKGHWILSKERTQSYNQILDEVSKVPKLDLFAMPEISLPWYMLGEFTRTSLKNQIGFVAGMEHLSANSIGYNIMLTCLPFKVEDDLDVIPIFRVKNHYSPSELKELGKLNINPPNLPISYHLIKWRDTYFSVYNCFELANLGERNLFNSMVDFVVAPVWNRDINYYNSIIDSATRDLHCFFVQSNTSQYGDSRIARPSKSEKKDKARVKGGTTKDYDFTLAVADLEIDQLREFQLRDYEKQNEWNDSANGLRKYFKKTPPGFNKANVEKRIKGELFFGQDIIEFLKTMGF